MDEYELTGTVFERPVVDASDPTPDGWLYAEGDNVRPKFESVAAAILWTWSLDSSQDMDAGDAQLGNGWHALFRSERAILHVENSGFVSAWRIDDTADIDDVWDQIEKGACYFDDDDDESDD